MDTHEKSINQEKQIEYSESAEFYFVGYCEACGTYARHGSRCSSCGFDFAEPADPAGTFGVHAGHQEHQSHG